MKRIFAILIVFVLPLMAMSQGKTYEYTPKVKNRVEIKNLVGGITLENSDGGSIVIESDFALDRPERADGLKLLGSAEDNTNIGLNVSEEDGVVTISGVTKQVRDYHYTIAIPKGMATSLDYGSPFASGDLEFDSFEGSLEVNTLSASIKINNCSGPLAINSVSGDVEVVFNTINQDEPTSLASVSGLIDVTVPTGAKATFEISNITGSVYNNLDLKTSAKKDKDDRASGLGAIKNRGENSYTLNGGGQTVYLNSVSGNIYLRKK